MIVRLLKTVDLPAVIKIQQSSPDASQWRTEDFASLMNSQHCGWVATNQDSPADDPIGFIFIRLVADEVEVLNLAVLPADRRKRIGDALLQAALGWARGCGAHKAWLDVRASNTAAIRFYEHAGFAGATRRKHYYRDPVEDAVVFFTSLGAAKSNR